MTQERNADVQKAGLEASQAKGPTAQALPRTPASSRAIAQQAAASHAVTSDTPPRTPPVSHVHATHGSSKRRNSRSKVPRNHFHTRWLTDPRYKIWLRATTEHVFCEACFARRAYNTSSGLFALGRIKRDVPNRVFATDMLKKHQESRWHRKNMEKLSESSAEGKGGSSLHGMKLVTTQATSGLIRHFRLVFKMAKLLQPLTQYPSELATALQVCKRVDYCMD